MDAQHQATSTSASHSRRKRTAAPKCKPISACNPAAPSRASINSAAAFPSKSSAAPSPTGCKPPTKKTPAPMLPTKKEDWYLVRAVATRPPGETSARTAETNTTTRPGDQNIPIAGWVISRFVELDLPDPVREGLNSANVRAVAWFELNRVPDASGEKPQYLVAGTKGPEGQACDFTTLRAYTWDAKKTRYETAFIENNLCGALPVLVGKDAKGEPEFKFHTIDGDRE